MATKKRRARKRIELFQIEQGAVYPEIFSQTKFLAVAIVFCHLLGFIYRVYVTNVIGDIGNNFYACAYDLYTFMLILTSFCIPSAVSKMVAEKIAVSQPKKAYRILMTVLVFSLAAGAAGAGLLYAGAGFLAATVMDTQFAVFPLRCLCFAIFFAGPLSVIRGFFQGTGSQIQNGISQVAEMLVKTVFAIVMVKRLYQRGVTVGTVLADVEHYSSAFGANAPAWGVSIGVGVALLIMLFLMWIYLLSFKKSMAKDRSRGRESWIGIMSDFFTIMGPVFFITGLMHLRNIISQGAFKKIGHLQGYTDDNISIMWGIYSGKYKLFLSVAISLAFAVGVMLSGRISQTYTDGDKGKLKDAFSRGIRYTMILVLPFTVFSAVYADKMLTMLFPGTLETLEESVLMIRIGAAGFVFMALFTVTSVFIHTLGLYSDYLQNLIFSFVLEEVVIILMMMYLRLNIYAVIGANMLFGVVMCGFNVWTLRRYFGYRSEVIRTYLCTIVNTGISCAATYATYQIFFEETENNTASLLVAFFAGICLYLILLIPFRCVTEEDILHLPYGEELAVFLKYFHLI